MKTLIGAVIILSIVVTISFVMVAKSKAEYISSHEVDGRPSGMFDPVGHFVSPEENRCESAYKTWVYVQIGAIISLVVAVTCVAILAHHKKEISDVSNM